MSANSEIGETFAALKRIHKERKEQNREGSAHFLEKEGIVFTSHNNDAHLIVEGPKGYIDFWPGTGRWISRTGTKQKGFGVKNLLVYIAANTTVYTPEEKE